MTVTLVGAAACLLVLRDSKQAWQRKRAIVTSRQCITIADREIHDDLISMTVSHIMCHPRGGAPSHRSIWGAERKSRSASKLAPDAH